MRASLTRIFSQVFKNFHTLRRNVFRLADIIVWPMIFFFTLTFFATYLGSKPVYVEMVLLGMMGWRMLYFMNLEMVNSFVEEYWARSLPNLMISPISRMEFAIGCAISGFIKALFVICIYLVAAYLIYGFTVPDWPVFLIAMAFFAIIGFSMGMATLGLSYSWKEVSFSLAFIWPDVIVLLSGVYFSVDAIYPAWLVSLVRLLPTTLAFDLLKSSVGLARADIPLLALLSILWVLLAYLFNGLVFWWARKRGKLARLG